MKANESRLVHLPPYGGEAVWLPGGDPNRFALCRFKATSENTGGAYALVELTLDPGTSGPPPHIHHREDQTFYVLEGRIEFQIGEDITTMEAGSFVHVPRGTLHSDGRNVGTEPARFLAMVVPGGLEGILYELGEPVTDPASPPSGPSNKEESKALFQKTAMAAQKYDMEIPGVTDQ